MNALQKMQSLTFEQILVHKHVTSHLAVDIHLLIPKTNTHTHTHTHTQKKQKQNQNKNHNNIQIMNTYLAS